MKSFFFLQCVFANIAVTLADLICFAREEHGIPDLEKSYFLVIVHCNSMYEECCDDGCCPVDNKNTTPPTPSVSRSRVWTQVWVCIVFFWCIVFASYILYVFFRKKTVSNSAGEVDELVAVSSDTSQVRESRAALLFRRDVFANSQFGNTDNSHGPSAPPPDYVTLTPPPSYNVAISFPQIHKSGNLESVAEEK